MPRLGRGFADRQGRAGQISQGFTDRNQAVLFLLHALFSHVPQTRQGHHHRLFLRSPLWNRHHRQGGEDAVGGIQLHGHSGE